MVYIKFDQGNIERLNLKQIREYNDKARKIGLKLILRGYMKCMDCLATIPLDMFIDDGFLPCKCNDDEKK